MTSILERRKSLHRQLQTGAALQQQLQEQMDSLGGLASIGTAAAMVAHEINNLLAPAVTYSDLALRHPEDKGLTEKALRRSMENCKKAAKVSEAILNMANGHNEVKEQLCLSELIDEVFSCICRDFSKDGIDVKIEVAENVTAYIEKIKLQQVIMNLVLNARDSLLETGGGCLQISAENQAGHTRIEIRDGGCGIDEQTLGRIFEPFFTTKTDNSDSTRRAGSGLGLAFCRRVIDEHGGTIKAKSELNIGSVFTIMLPDK